MSIKPIVIDIPTRLALRKRARALTWDAVARRLNHSVLLRHALFMAAAWTSIVLIGYHFGTFDQAVHIPFLKAAVDPSLFPGDKFLDARAMHYSYFWLFFQLFYRLGCLEIAMFVVHVLATYLTFWSIWELSLTLFSSPLAALLSVVAFIFPHMGWAGFPAIEFSLLNRTFVLPFLLLALNLFLRRRYLLAFVLLGLMYNLHIVSVNFMLGMILFDCLIELRRVGWRNVLVGMLAFLVAALPVLWWKMHSTPVELAPNPQWLSAISGMLYNLFHPFGPYPHILLATLGGAGGLAMFWVARAQTPGRPIDRTIDVMIVAVLLVLVVQTVTALWLPVTIIIQLQIIRAGMFGLILGYLYFAHYLARQLQTRTMGRLNLSLLAGTFISAPISAVAILGWVVQRWVKPARLRPVLAFTLLAGTWVGVLIAAFQYQVWYPGVYIFPRQTAWHDVQFWARDHTPRDALFITPPQNWGFYSSEWRVLSERSTVVSMSELLEIALVPEHLDTWLPRFETLAPSALERFNGDCFANMQITEQAFNALSQDDLLRAACKYDASYLVVEKSHPRDLPLVYENPEYAVYDLRPAKLCASGPGG